MIDYTHILKDAGLVAASAPGTISGEAKIVNLGAGLVEGVMVVDVTAIEIASNNEFYKISLQGSSESDFASDYEDLSILELGPAETLSGDTDSTIGRYKVPFRTERNGTVYKYVRSYTHVSGEVSTGINYSCHLTKI